MQMFVIDLRNGQDIFIMDLQLFVRLDGERVRGRGSLFEGGALSEGLD
jgi:hypothetical protein